MATPSSSTHKPEDNKPQSQTAVKETDWFLQNLVLYVNQGIEFGITLQLTGVLVSGTLISSVRYFEEAAESFFNGFQAHPEIAESFQQLILSSKEVYEAPLEEEGNFPFPQYIHLRDASFFVPGQRQNFFPLKQGVLWRGQISEVRGFHLGKLAATD